MKTFEMFKMYNYGSTFHISRPTKSLRLSNLKKCVNLGKELKIKCILRSSEEENNKIHFIAFELKSS